MLTRTFLHFPQVGERRERALWRFGFCDWHAIVRSVAPSPWCHLWDEWQREAEMSLRAYEVGDATYFAGRLPKSAWWRAIPDFVHRAVFLDVETDGTHRITVLGIADGEGYRAFVRGQDDWDEARERLATAKMLVTYGGSHFDLPVLRTNFPDWQLPPLHLDLCPLLRRLGLRGGLKAVERQVGLSRSPETDGLNGWDAVHLWWRYVDYNDERALATLLRYNREDVVHLSPLLALVYERLWEQTLRATQPTPLSVAHDRQ
ncbi:MAG: ribonuclease H-like domain-containing protein [Armatimonadota bacterium]|nr:ribonuclease H-like domain-containing protein [Armatimonadota bacterium]